MLSYRDNDKIIINYKGEKIIYNINFVIPFNASYKYMAICLTE